VAANYLPAITLSIPSLQPEVKRAATKDEDRPVANIVAGKTYQFQLALTNPLYDPIQVRLSAQRMHVSMGDSSEKAKRPPFAVSLPTSVFPIAAFAEAWEYDDDEEMFGIDDDDELGGGGGTRGGREREGKSKNKTVGVLEKRANVTIVGGEVVIGKEAKGHVKVCIYIVS
jgi:dynactin-4